MPPRPQRKQAARFTGQACGGKTFNRFAILSLLLPERHDAFAWAGRTGKKFLLSVCVCVCLWLKLLFFYRTASGSEIDKMAGIYTGKRAYHFDGIDVLPLNDFLERLHGGEIF